MMMTTALARGMCKGTWLQYEVKALFEEVRKYKETPEVWVSWSLREVGQDFRTLRLNVTMY